MALSASDPKISKKLKVSKLLKAPKLTYKRTEALNFYKSKIANIIRNSPGIHNYRIQFTGINYTHKWYVIIPHVGVNEFLSPQRATQLQYELRRHDHLINQNAYYVSHYSGEEGEDKSKCFVQINLWQLKNLTRLKHVKEAPKPKKLITFVDASSQHKMTKESLLAEDTKSKADTSNLKMENKTSAEQAQALPKDLSEKLEKVKSAFSNPPVVAEDKSRLYVFSEELNPYRTTKIINGDFEVSIHRQTDPPSV